MTSKKDENAKKARKATGRPFKKGHSGGPGRPPGRKPIVDAIRENLSQETDLEAAAKKALEILMGGMNHSDEKVQRECARDIAKIAPKFTYLKLDEEFELNTLKDIGKLNRALTKDVSKGKIALEKAKAFKELLAHDRDSLRDEISEEMLKNNAS